MLGMQFPTFMSSISWSLFASFVFSFCLLLQGCRPSDPMAQEVLILPNAAQLGNEAFSPKLATVPAGGRITWVNRDNVPHSVVGNATKGPCAFDSGEIAPGGKYSKGFAERMVCGYTCSLHGRAMRGRLEVF